MHPRREQLLLVSSCRPRYNFGFRLSRGCAHFQPGRVAEPKRFAAMAGPSSHALLQSSDVTYRVSRSWWSRSIICNPHPRKTKARHPSSLYRRLLWLNILYDSLHPLRDLFSNFIAALGCSSRSHMAGVVELLVAIMSEVNSPPTYRYARRSYTCTHFHPLCGAGSTVYFPVILLPYL